MRHSPLILPDGRLAGGFPNINLRRYLDGEVIAPPVMVTGYVGWELRRNGIIIRDSGGLHPNLVLNTGLDRMAAIIMFNTTNAAMVGTGSNVPAVTDTGLQTPIGTSVGRATLSGTTYNATGGYWTQTATYKWLESNANGNLTEFGAWDGAVFWSRQLLKDAMGTPTTITKTNTDQLIITYETRLYAPTAAVVGTVVISGVTYDVTTKATWRNYSGGGWPSFLNNNGVLASTPALAFEDNTIQSVDSGPTGASGSSVNTNSPAYVSGNYYVDKEYTWDITSANFATGIGAIGSFPGSTSGGAQALMFHHYFTTTKLPKDGTKKLILTFRRSWTRYP